MKNLENFGVQEMSAKEIKETEGGWILPVLRGIAYALGIYASLNEECDNCLNKAIASHDSSLGGSRPFE
jgi:hypothetical protein|tara:strand:+ start:289 stop:495 length:207 start_codon:yes stop_codon:yes gene_type:complete